MFKFFSVGKYEVGLKFRNNEFVGIMNTGRHWLFDPFNKIRVRIVSTRDTWLVDQQLDLIVKSCLLADRLEVIDLKDHQRALVWIDGRFERVLAPGLYAIWRDLRIVQVELVDSRNVRFEHKDLKAIVKTPEALRLLDVCRVERDRIGVLYIDGRYVAQLVPGHYAFWRDAADSKVVEVDMREAQIDISGQEIMTADKVTLRLNAIVTYKIKDAARAVSTTGDVRQSLYRDAQLAIRAVVGSRELDSFLAGKDDVASELQRNVTESAESVGVEILSLGIRDVILPGEMKDLLNKVTEAKKASEANLILRREETAAMRSQANTAKLLADNPTLMRLRELETLEKIAANGKLNVVLGEKGLSDRVINLL